MPDGDSKSFTVLLEAKLIRLQWVPLSHDPIIVVVLTCRSSGCCCLDLTLPQKTVAQLSRRKKSKTGGDRPLKYSVRLKDRLKKLRRFFSIFSTVIEPPNPPYEIRLEIVYNMVTLPHITISSCPLRSESPNPSPLTNPLHSSPSVS